MLLQLQKIQIIMQNFYDNIGQMFRILRISKKWCEIEMYDIKILYLAEVFIVLHARTYKQKKKKKTNKARFN